MKLKIVIITLLLGFGSTLFAYPITPRPLRKLILESELIVYADVIGFGKSLYDDPWADATAVLVVKDLLQGEPSGDTITVGFSPGMICPAPAYYEKNTSVLAFLDKNKRRSKDNKSAKKADYSTHALSYGSKTLTESEYRVYRSRILEMHKILTLKDKALIERKTINWLVACACKPETRWEGVYELSPSSDFMFYYDEGQEAYLKDIQLNEMQNTRMREAVFAIDTMNYHDLGLVDLVVKDEDPEMLEFLTKQFKLLKEDIWMTKYLMRRIAPLANREDLNAIVEKLNALTYGDKDKKEKEKLLVQEFIEAL